MTVRRLHHRLWPRLVALVLLASLAPGTLRAGVPHGGACAAHTAAAAAAADGHASHTGHAPAAPAGPALAAATDCTHCLASGCITLSSCAGAAPAITRSPAQGVIAHLAARAAGLVWRPAFSRTGQPPTPPPSALL